jgi:hypothetical protein
MTFCSASIDDAQRRYGSRVDGALARAFFDGVCQFEPFGGHFMIYGTIIPLR